MWRQSRVPFGRINDDGAPGALRVIKYRGWLEFVKAFVRKWGVDLLPQDICSSVNSVEDGIGV